MAVMFFSKDGPRPDNQRGPGIDLTLEEIGAVFPGDPLHYVGAHPPSFGPARVP